MGSRVSPGRRLVLLGLVTSLLSAVGTTARADSGIVPVFARTLGGPQHAQIYPSGMEVASNGDLIVADTANNQIVRFSSSGTELWRVGSHGSGIGQFLEPRDVGIDSVGNIYVIDTDNARVVKLDASGNWLTSFTPPVGQKMGFPLGITVAGSLVYVADTGSKLVRVFDTSGNQIRTIGANGVCTYNGIRDATADASGNVYIANYAANDILKMTATGTCIAKWGVKGSGDGQFNTPYGIAVANDPVLGVQAVYVADANNERIQEFRTDGSFVAKVGTSGAPGVAGTFTQLRRVAVATDGSGDIWGADLWGWRIERFARGAGGYTYAQTIGTPLSAPTDSSVFQEPRGISFESDGTTDVIDTVHHRIVRMTPTGHILNTCGTRGSTPGNFNWPRGIAVDQAGANQIWVTDTKQNRIQIIRGSDCRPLAKFGTKGASPTQFNWPRSIAIRASDRTAWIADTYNNRIAVYKVATRAEISVYGFHGSTRGKFNFPCGVAVNPANGHVFVADTGNNRIVELSDSGGAAISWVRVLKSSFLSPSGVAVDSVGRIYVADSGNNRVVVLNPTGSVYSIFTVPDGFDSPESVALDAAGNIYVSDTFHDRVQVYTAFPH